MIELTPYWFPTEAAIRPVFRLRSFDGVSGVNLVRKNCEQARTENIRASTTVLVFET